MVCKTGCGRMAAMVRLLSVRSCPEITPEEDTHEKIAAQIIRKEFHDADEANLLAEEDMHVFDCRPLTDPLHLVCCNDCRKPVKASQYAAHAERCRSLNFTKDDFLELDGGSSHKKPPKKGRKTSQATNVPNCDKQGGMLSSQSRQAQRTPALVDHTTALDASEIGIGGKEFHRISNAETKVPGNTPNSYQKAKRYIQRNAPVPLATKIYYSQGNKHLRSELGHLYREACAKEHGNDSLSPELMQDKGTMSTQVSSSSKLLQKKDMYSLAAVWSPDQTLAQSSEVLLETPGGPPSAANFPNNFREDSFSKPEVAAASVGMMKTIYRSASYSYPANSGLALGTMQKTNGSVSVV